MVSTNHFELSPGEAWVAAYLRQRRLPWTFENPVGGRHPDFHVVYPAGTFVVEVYEPEIRLPSRTGPCAFDSYPHLRNAFKGRKGKQASAARKEGVPYVVALAGTRSDIGIDPLLVAGAAFGNIGTSFPVGPGVDPDAPVKSRMVFLGGARLQKSINRGVSAIAVPMVFNPTRWKVEATLAARLGDPRNEWTPNMRPGTVRRIQTRIAEVTIETYQHAIGTGSYDEDARVLRTALLHNPHAQNPLSREIFNGPHDEQWWQEPDGTYGPRVTGPLIHEYRMVFA